MTFLSKVKLGLLIFFFLLRFAKKTYASVADFSFGIGYRLSCFILFVAVKWIFLKLSIKNCQL